MSANVKEQELSSRSPNNSRRPLSIIEENDDDGMDANGAENSERENGGQEVGHGGDNPKPEVTRSPSFKAIKQFFIEKTESHSIIKSKTSPDEKGLKQKKVETKKKLGSDTMASHSKLTKTKSPDSTKTTPTSPTKTHQPNASKVALFSRTSARIAPKTHPTPKSTPSTTTQSKRLESNHKSSTPPAPKTVSSTAKPKPSATSHVRDTALKTSSSFGAADKRIKTSFPAPTKLAKSNSVGSRVQKKTVTKRDSTGSKDTPKKSDSEGKENSLDRSMTDSPMSQTSENQDHSESNLSVIDEVSLSTKTRVSDDSKNLQTHSDGLSKQDRTLPPQDVATITQPTPVKTLNSSNEQDSCVLLKTNLTPKCESEKSSNDPPNVSLGEHPTIPIHVPTTTSSTPNTISIHMPTTTSSTPNEANQVVVAPVIITQNLPTEHTTNDDKSQHSDEKNNNTENLNHNNICDRPDDHFQTPLTLIVSPPPPSSSLTSLSPSSLSPSLSHKYSQRSPKIISKLRTSPTLSRRFSIERNNNKTTSINGKLTPVSLISASNTFPRSISKDFTPSDFSNEDGKDYGFSLDRSKLAAAGASRTMVPGSPLLASIYRSARRGSYFFKRKQSTDSLSSLSESETLESTWDDVAPISATDLARLKETADRLHLTTRRASIMTWRQNYMDDTGLPRVPPDLNGGDPTDETLTVERKQKINEALDWLRNELQDMRTQDQALARQLLSIRQDIHQLKLQRCTEEHQDLLDDFKSELEELEEFSDVLDLPNPIYEDNPLKHIGITRHNISARRFSAC